MSRVIAAPAGLQQETRRDADAVNHGTWEE
jgi:hypothetical protein